MRSKILPIAILGLIILLTACSGNGEVAPPSVDISSNISSTLSSESYSSEVVSEVTSIVSSESVPSELPSPEAASSKISEPTSSKEIKKEIDLFEPITFRVVDKDNKPVLNAEPQISQTQYLTSSSGEFTIVYYPQNTSLKPLRTGNHVAEIKYNILSDTPSVEKVAFSLTKDSYKSVVILQIKGKVSNEENFDAPKRVEIVVNDTNGNPVKDLRISFGYAVPQSETETNVKKDSFLAYTNEDGRVVCVGANPTRRYGLGFEARQKEKIGITCTMPDGTEEVVAMRYYERANYECWSGSIGGEKEPIYITADSEVTLFNVIVDRAPE